MRLRSRLAARAIRNRSGTGNIARRVLITMPAGCAHLMPDEGGDGDEECGAHEKRRRERRQVLKHRAPPFGPGDLRVPARPAPADLPPAYRWTSAGPAALARHAVSHCHSGRSRGGPGGRPAPGAPGDADPEDHGRRPAPGPPVSVVRGSIGSAADAGGRRQTRPDTVRRGRKQ